MHNEESESRVTNNHHRMKSPICCLRSNSVVEPESMTTIGEQRTPRSPYSWLKSTAHELELRDRCRRVKSRIIKNNNCGFSCVHLHHQNHQRHQSQSYPGDFSYNLSSYLLNFEDDLRDNEDGSFPDFTARLPQSPVTKTRSTTVDLISF